MQRELSVQESREIVAVQDLRLIYMFRNVFFSEGDVQTGASWIVDALKSALKKGAFSGGMHEDVLLRFGFIPVPALDRNTVIGKFMEAAEEEQANGAKWGYEHEVGFVEVGADRSLHIGLLNFRKDEDSRKELVFSPKELTS